MSSHDSISRPPARVERTRPAIAGLAVAIGLWLSGGAYAATTTFAGGGGGP